MNNNSTELDTVQSSSHSAGNDVSKTEKVKSNLEILATDVPMGNMGDGNDSDNDSFDNNEESFAGVIKPSIALRGDPHYRINPERYHGWFRSYVRQDWGTVNAEAGGELNELRAGWIELFFDLIFVAGIVHISSESVYALDRGDDSGFSTRRRLVDPPDGEIGTTNLDFLICTFAQFGLLMQLWNEQVQFESRFANEQLFDAAVRFLTMASILSMGSCIQDSQEYFQAFLLSFAIAKLFLMVSYSKTSLIPRARNHCLLNIFLSGILVIASIVCCLTVVGDATTWLVTFSCIFVVHYSSGWLQWKWTKYDIPVPVNVPHMAERMGLFTMLILGESIISLMTADIDLNIGIMLIIFTGFIVAYALGQLYFSCQPSEEKILLGSDSHAMRKGGWRARVFAVSHHLLWFSLLGLGVGAKVATFHIDNKHRQPIDTMLSGYSVFLACVALNLIRLSHPFEHRTKWVWGVRAACMVAMAILPALWNLDNSLILGLITLCVLIQVVIDEEGKEAKRELRDEVKEKVKTAVERQQTGFGTRSESSSTIIKSKSELKDRTDKNDTTNYESGGKNNDNNNNNNNSERLTDPNGQHKKDDSQHLPSLKDSDSKRNSRNTDSNLSPHRHFKKQVSGFM